MASAESAAAVANHRRSSVSGVRVAALLVTYMVGLLALGVIFTPPAYRLVHFAGRALAWPYLAKIPFPRVFDRVLLVGGLIGLAAVARILGVRGRADLALGPNALWGRHLAFGLSISLAVGVALAWLSLRAGFRIIDRRVTCELILRGLATGLAAGVIEEIFFRGFLLGILWRTRGVASALLWTSVAYVLVHFLGAPPGGVRPAGGPTLATGVQVVMAGFWRFGEPMRLLGRAVTLGLLGLLLAWTVVRTNSLALAIGLHGGVATTLKLMKTLTGRVGPGNVWLGEDLVSGLMPAAAMGTTALAVFMVLRWTEDRRGPGRSGAAAAGQKGVPQGDGDADEDQDEGPELVPHVELGQKEAEPAQNRHDDAAGIAPIAHVETGPEGDDDQRPPLGDRRDAEVVEEEGDPNPDEEGSEDDETGPHEDLRAFERDGGLVAPDGGEGKRLVL